MIEVAKIQNQPATMIELIQTAVTAGNIELAERMLAMQERVQARNAEAEFNIAMTECQSQMRRIAADANNKQTNSKYATYGKLDAVLRPIYTAQGFSLSFSDADSPKAEHVRVVCIVRHRSGHKETHYKDMPADGKGAKGGDVMTKTHAAGAAQSYGMRYLLKGIFNVAIGEEDTDGNMPGDMLTLDQITELTDLAKEKDVNQKRFYEYMQVTCLAEVRAKDYQKAKAAINSMGRRQ